MRNSVILKLVGFGCLLLALRIAITGHFSFVFLLWNVFLAWLPYFLSKRSLVFPDKWSTWISLPLVLLFLPNAPYIVTDLFHLQKNLLAPVWLDTLLILNFSLCGLIFFVLCADHLFAFLNHFIQNKHLFRLCRLLIFLSNGYGIYLGRNLRFNSWDLVADPMGLLIGIKDSFFSWRIYETVGISLTYGIFLYLFVELYYSLKLKLKSKAHELFEET